MGAADEPDAATRALLDAVRTAGAEVATLRQDFVQERALALLDEPLRTPGVVLISRPQQAVRWEFTDQMVLILVDGELRRYGADGQRETVDGGGRQLAAQMQAMLSGEWRGMGEGFHLAGDRASRRLVLTPHDEALARVVAAITVTFRDDLLAPAELVVESIAGDRTVYRFAAPALDVAIPADEFQAP